MQRRILLLVMACIMLVLVSVGIISQLSIKKSVSHSLDTHLTLATFIARNIDHMLEQNITRLHDISSAGMVDFEDGNWESETRALRTAFEYSIFSDGLFLLDLKGNVVLTFPFREEANVSLLGMPFVEEALTKNKLVISNIYTHSPSGRKSLFVLVPLRNSDGETVGIVGGEINPADYMFSRIMKSITEDTSMLIELVDRHGIVISSSKPDRTLTFSDHDQFLGNLISQKKSFVGICHRCHMREPEENLVESDMLAFAPLSFAPWGIAVRDPEHVVFAPSTSLRKSFLIISLIIIAAAVLLSMGLSRSIVWPIRLLTGATQKIAGGDLTETIRVPRHDEIGVLAQSFEKMRERLAESLDNIQKHNIELEHRVNKRTEELNRRKKQLSALLDFGMKAQEEERKRIARELHDDTSQSLSALGMSIEIATLALEHSELKPEMLVEQRERVSSLVDSITRIIKDLRPPVLDDLGMESAIYWLLERHLVPNDIKYEICTDGLQAINLDKRAELSMFRIIQEAIINASKHSKANKVCILMSQAGNEIEINIIDDGVGFEAETVFETHIKDGEPKGFGLLGLRERVMLLGGELKVNSFIHEGTQVNIVIPLNSLKGGTSDAKDKNPDRG